MRGKTESFVSVLVIPMASPRLAQLELASRCSVEEFLEGGEARTEGRGLGGEPICIFPTLHVLGDGGHALRGKRDSVIGKSKGFKNGPLSVALYNALTTAVRPSPSSPFLLFFPIISRPYPPANPSLNSQHSQFSNG